MIGANVGANLPGTLKKREDCMGSGASGSPQKRLEVWRPSFFVGVGYDPEPLFSVSLPKGKAICSNLLKSVQEQKEQSCFLLCSPLSLEGEQNRKNSGLLR